MSKRTRTRHNHANPTTEKLRRKKRAWGPTRDRIPWKRFMELSKLADARANKKLVTPPQEQIASGTKIVWNSSQGTEIVEVV